MKQLRVALSSSVLWVLSTGAMAALPAVGYYKDFYSPDHGSFVCSQVTSNTKQIKLGDKKVTYFEAIGGSGTPMVCLPQVFVDTDDTDVDGSPTGLLMVSASTAFCTTVDGKTSVEVNFDAKHIFWGGDSYAKTKIADLGISVPLKQKEKQTGYLEFFSTTGCP